MFAVNGMTFASFVPRYPEIKAQLAASRTLWGLAVGIGPVGGLLLGLSAAALMARFGSRAVAVWPQVMSTAFLLVLAGADHIAWVFVAMIAMSAFDALTDTAMNYQGLRVQELYGRSIINTFHGWWSIGAVAGGLVGSAMAQWRVPLVGQAVGTLVVLAGVAWLAWSLMLPTSQFRAHREPTVAGPQDLQTTPGADAGRARVSAPTWARIVALGVMGALAGGIETGGATWAPLVMNSQFTVTPFVAGLGFVALMTAETVGRLVGDAVVDRMGAPATVVQGALVCLVGMGVAVAWPTVWTSLVGFACAGWGVATMIPLAMHAADSLPGVPAGVGLTVATWVMRIGFMAFPVGIGALGDALDLRWALTTLPVAAVAILALVPMMRPVAVVDSSR